MSVEVAVPQSMSLLRIEEMEYLRENKVIARNMNGPFLNRARKFDKHAC